jgi:DNA repair protein RadA/Sms
MSKVRPSCPCRECGQQLARWAGRCPGCGAWGTIEEGGLRARRPDPSRPSPTRTPTSGRSRRVCPASIASSAAGWCHRRWPCSRGSPASASRPFSSRWRRACRAPGSPACSRPVRSRAVRSRPAPTDSGSTDRACRSCRVASCPPSSRPLGPHDPSCSRSIRSRRSAIRRRVRCRGDPRRFAGARTRWWVRQGRGISVLVTGHVTKDGDLAGPRALEHAVDVVLAFDGDPRSGLRMLSAGKNRFGAEGEVAWFEMTGAGCARSTRASSCSRAGRARRRHGPPAGRPAWARVEVQALVARGEGTARRQASGLDLRRFQLVGRRARQRRSRPRALRCVRGRGWGRQARRPGLRPRGGRRRSPRRSPACLLRPRRPSWARSG